MNPHLLCHKSTLFPGKVNRGERGMGEERCDLKRQWRKEKVTEITRRRMVWEHRDIEFCVGKLLKQ